MSNTEPAPSAAPAAAAASSTDAAGVVAHVKSEIAKLEGGAASIEVKLVSEARPLWARYEIYVIAIAASALTLAVAHVLHL